MRKQGVVKGQNQMDNIDTNIMKEYFLVQSCIKTNLLYAVVQTVYVFGCILCEDDKGTVYNRAYQNQ